jgi:RimJ/RimL family protein N-acetyltransferase
MENMPVPRNAPRALKARLGIVGHDAATASTDWRQRLPVLTGSLVTLRPLELRDAPSLLALLTPHEVSRFISPPPTTVAGFERFILWTHGQRQLGEYVCYGVVPRGMSVAVGLFQVRRQDPAFTTAEWGFVLGSAFWGTGMFVEAATLTVDFSMGTLGVHRLEARAALANGRGNGALRKIGAIREGVLRQSFLRSGEYLDQAIWSILDCDWLQGKRRWDHTIPSH